MPDVLRIKRRLVAGGAGAPSALANAELAYNEASDILYYGKGGTASAAASIIPIAGPGLSGGGPFLPLTAGVSNTLTGDLFINKSTASIFINNSDATVNQIVGRRNSFSRWSLILGDGSVESGSNAGSNFQLVRYADNASSLGSVLIINRATGLATVTGDPIAALGIATKQYVDNKPSGSSVVISDTAPATPNPGDLWFDSLSANTFIRYNDGTSIQWVPVINQPGVGNPVPIASGGTGAVTAPLGLLNLGGVAKIGDTMTGPLIINQNTAALPVAGAQLLIGGANGSVPAIQIDSFGVQAAFNFYRLNGTATASTAIAISDILSTISGFGYDGSAPFQGARILYISREAWTTASHGTHIEFQNCAPGTNVLEASLILGRGVCVGTPITNDPGPGSVNVSGSYQVNGRNVTPGQIGATAAFAGTVPAAVANNQMLGLGYRVTPQSSTRMLAMISGSFSFPATPLPNTASISLRYGTGASPTAGSGIAGTQATTIQATSNIASQQIPCCMLMVISGLTIGTTYWFDAGIVSLTSGSIVFFNLSYIFLEV